MPMPGPPVVPLWHRKAHDIGLNVRSPQEIQWHVLCKGAVEVGMPTKLASRFFRIGYMVIWFDMQLKLTNLPIQTFSAFFLGCNILYMILYGYMVWIGLIWLAFDWKTWQSCLCTCWPNIPISIFFQRSNWSEHPRSKNPQRSSKIINWSAPINTSIVGVCVCDLYRPQLATPFLVETHQKPSGCFYGAVPRISGRVV